MYARMVCVYVCEMVTTIGCLCLVHLYTNMCANVRAYSIRVLIYKSILENDFNTYQTTLKECSINWCLIFVFLIYSFCIGQAVPNDCDSIQLNKALSNYITNDLDSIDYLIQMMTTKKISARSTNTFGHIVRLSFFFGGITFLRQRARKKEKKRE